MRESREQLIRWLFDQRCRDSINPVGSLGEWKKVLGSESDLSAAPIERAICLGYKADRVAYAFIAGFQAALQSLFPDLQSSQLGAICITESGGNHPSAIQTRLAPPEDGTGDDAYRLKGEKTFITSVSEADFIYVAASIGVDDAGRNRIKMLGLDRATPGIELSPMAPLSFIPEIDHGTVSFDEVIVSSQQILPGDGYDDYIKPFRMIEEIHVTGALIGYLIQTAFQYDCERSITEQLLALLTLSVDLAAMNVKAAETHILFSGYWRLLEQMIDTIDSAWKTAPESVKHAWKRDREVLTIARKARETRLNKAWAELGVS